MKILFSNLGYAKGISGSLQHHVRYSGRHVYVPPPVQQQVLEQFRALINAHRPDLCCLVEVDRGSFHSGYFNQIQALMCGTYCFHDIAGKYGDHRWVTRLPFHRSKCNAFLGKSDFPFERHYFSRGSKRLIYKLELTQGLTLFFSHFSLQQRVRQLQFAEMHRLVKETKGESIILADFNILNGFAELQPLLGDGHLCLLNREDEPTFTFHRRQLVLDLCLCSKSLAGCTTLTVIPQPFSDHAALLVEISPPQ